MSKKIIAIVLMVLLVVTALASCKSSNKGKDNVNSGVSNSNGNSTNNSGDKGSETSHVIFSQEETVTLVKGSGAKDLNAVKDLIFDLTGRFAGIVTGTTLPDGNEIIFGNADREICKKANEKLETLVRKGTIEFEDAGRNVDRLGVFVIYAEGGSVAMVWNNNNIAESAVEFFIENYMNNSVLVLDDGYTYSEIFDYIEFMEKAEIGRAHV